MLVVRVSSNFVASAAFRIATAMQLRTVAGCLLLASAGAIKINTAPDVAERVAMESQENLQIHDGFKDQETKDIQKEKQVKADKDLSALLQTRNYVAALDKDMKTQIFLEVVHQGIVDPCESISCAGSLKCPAGFTVESVPGHCCPYCVNPNIEIPPEITGATGSHGGKISTFCPKVFCFPTMCSGTETQPTTTNGACCSSCSS